MLAAWNALIRISKSIRVILRKSYRFDFLFNILGWLEVAMGMACMQVDEGWTLSLFMIS